MHFQERTIFSNGLRHSDAMYFWEMLKRFSVRVILLIALILITSLAFSWVVLHKNWTITGFFLAITLFVLGMRLFQLTNSTNREVSKLILALKSNDYSQRFLAEYPDSSFKELSQAFETITAEFSKLKANQESRKIFLQSVLNQVGIGFICFDMEGNLEFINPAFLNLFHVPHLSHLNGLRKVKEELPELLLSIKNGQNITFSIQTRHALLKLSVTASDLVSSGKGLKILSVKDVYQEIDHSEAEAWQKLIRVLTHEIMNSITPVSSLAGALKESIENPNTPIEKEEILEGLDSIKRRSEGLLKFVDSYRKLTKIPPPQLEKILVADLLDQVIYLFSKELSQKGISLQRKYMEGEEVFADYSQIEQVLINLIKNAIESLENKENPILTIGCQRTIGGEMKIEVGDNGSGIPPELLDKVFVPFFTTKPQGSGIGLSLSREIMRQHKGRLLVKSHPGETVFGLIFQPV